MRTHIHDMQTMLDKIRGTVALSFSYQAEDVAALHVLLQSRVDALEVFTLDTLKGFPETEHYHIQVESFFGIRVKRYYPDAAAVSRLEADLGEWGMRSSLDDRHRCCNVRKVEPLSRALAGKSAWVTGLRRAQSVTRAEVPLAEYDEVHGLFKLNPLAQWSDAELADYITANRLPVHPLYAQGFKSIGCAPCTRAVKDGEDIRAGRWWWENPEHKECGLHVAPVQ